MRLRISRYSGLMLALSKPKRIDFAVQRHDQAHGGATRFGDLSESLLQLCKFSLSRLPIFLSLLCCLSGLLLLGGGLLPRKLRLHLRVRLGLLRQVALLSGCLAFAAASEAC